MYLSVHVSLLLAGITKRADIQHRFRWVQCQLDHIRTLRTGRDIKTALQRLPPNLNETYDDILKRVPVADLEYLRRALQFVVFSARPMTIVEVAEAIVIQPGMHDIDEDDRLQRPEDLLDMGSSLFAQDHQAQGDKRLLELSHYSVKEYLLSDRTRNGPVSDVFLDKVLAQASISKCCLTYLAFEVFDSAWKDFDIQTQTPQKPDMIETHIDSAAHGHLERLSMYPFLGYSALHLFDHCKDEAVQKVMAPLIRETFSPERSGSFRNMTYTCVFNLANDWEYMYMRVFQYSLLTIAARFGLKVIVQDLLDHGVPADSLCPTPAWVEYDDKPRSALCHVAESGNEVMCNILLRAGAQVNNSSFDHDCPLSAAARSGEPAVVRLLLDAGADVQRNTKLIALSLLTCWWRFLERRPGQIQILELFREAGARWVTMALLHALSKICGQILRHFTEVQANNSDDDHEIAEVAVHIHEAIEGLEDFVWAALQWLLQDRKGVIGLKAMLEVLILALYNSQPQLLRQDVSSFARKYKAEEVLAENLMHIYFDPEYPGDETPIVASHAVPSANLLILPWKEKGNQNTQPTTTGSAAWKPQDFIICGDFLRSFMRSRWDPAFVNFYD